MIVGPCSAWPKEAVLEYAERLLEVNEQVKQSLKVVMRSIYLQYGRNLPTDIVWTS